MSEVPQFGPGMLLDAICGTDIPISLADDLERRGLVKFSGNQHNPSWSWIRARLAGFSLSELKTLYEQTKTE